MVRTISFIDATAHGAGLGRISGIYVNHGDTGQPSLILDKALQFAKAPVVESCSLPASGRYPAAYTLEFLKSYGTAGALRLLHDSFGNAVVSILLKSGLLARELAQFATSSARTLPLQIAATVRVYAALLLDWLTRTLRRGSHGLLARGGNYEADGQPQAPT